jgi:hypothetical protein
VIPIDSKAAIQAVASNIMGEIDYSMQTDATNTQQTTKTHCTPVESITHWPNVK